MNRAKLEHLIRAVASNAIVRGSVATFLLVLCSATTLPGNWLADVRHFIYLTQNIHKDDTVDKLAASPYELVVIDSLANQHGGEKADMKAIVKGIRDARAGRHVLCYLDVGEAEEYRNYWDKSWFGGWKGASSTSKGKPDFILAPRI